jgi:hypothetical protein
MGPLWLLAVQAAFFASSGCSHPEGQDLLGPPFFAATLDGASWFPDTATGTVFASPTDTTVIIGASRQVSAQEEQDIVIVLHGFGTPRQVPLADSTSRAVAFFSVTQISGGFLPPTLTYWSQAEHPGLVAITGVSRNDSAVIRSTM